MVFVGQKDTKVKLDGKCAEFGKLNITYYIALLVLVRSLLIRIWSSFWTQVITAAFVKLGNGLNLESHRQYISAEGKARITAIVEEANQKYANHSQLN